MIGTLGSNRLYTVGRVVKVVDLMRWRFAPRGFDSLRISMQNSSQIQSARGDVSLRVYEHVEASLFGVHRTVNRLPCRSPCHKPGRGAISRDPVHASP